VTPPEQPEFSRPERVDTIGAGEKTVRIAADAGERAALARRFDLLGIESLEASFSVRREAGGIVAEGRVTGAVTQACSASGEPVPAKVDEAVALRFVEALDEAEELELSPDALDTLPIEGGAVDLGEAAAETLALALDPFPRHPDAAAKLAEAGVLGEEQAGPFGALADLKRKLEG
jgi:uncharacterized metal-binding protein YceD (DUF177 family)